ncbi:MAG: glycosyltransferase [Candidatus Latescibacteria bacterium]|nr:glycosyltransferase [Candidatus Latescibacterota bacterium]NIM20886.1 glycosyltransferase [Candidatus Latescibacterota bacterium]NIM65021.1 glycosyltransferase [Candidatus Latescibacterota bacterium]NIO01536.1 glycosyltransferase [Candidatus Latescibacterota bacterium]NIO28053.1 glycosyltransferase [Candidatus Latescibacterota bacterium]
MTISVVIPCYNEEEGIQHVIRAMPSCVDEIVVVDNNSTDRTGEVAKSLGAKVVFEERKGYGAAYKAGLPAVTADITVTMDGDGSYPSEQIAELVDHLLDNDLDFVSAARFPLKNPAAMSFSNRMGNMILTIAMLVLYGKNIKDSQSGMWVFKSNVYPRLNVTSGGMPFSEEIKIEAIRAKDIRFGEYRVNYHERIGEVKLEKWRDGFRNLFFLVKKRFQ